MNMDSDENDSYSKRITNDYITRLETLLQKLHEELRKTDISLNKYKKERKQLLDENEALKNFISTLFKIARSEIERKQNILNKLRAKCENVVFRREENYCSQKRRSNNPYNTHRRQTWHEYRNHKDIFYSKGRVCRNGYWLSAKPEKTIKEENSPKKSEHCKDFRIHHRKYSFSSRKHKLVDGEYFDLKSEKSFKNSKQLMVQLNQTEPLSWNTPRKIVNSEMKDFSFQPPLKLITPIRDTPDYLKQKMKALESRIRPVMQNEFKKVDNYVGSNLNADDIKFIGYNDTGLQKIDICVKSPFKNCIVMKITSNCCGDVNSTNSAVPRSSTSSCIDIEHGKFSREGRKPPVLLKKVCTPG